MRTSYIAHYAEHRHPYLWREHRRTRVGLLATPRGFLRHVVERAPAPRPGGQTVDLRGAGRDVVTRMGLIDQARAVSVKQRGLTVVDAADRIIARMPADSFGGEGIISETEILRGDLCRLLYDATLPHTEYLFDDTITTLNQDDEGVTVGFEKARPRRFGLVIGTDGSHSAVRTLVFGPETDYVHALGLYTAWFTINDEMDLDGWYRMYNAPGGLVASVRPGRLPGEIKAALGFRSAPIAYDRHDTAAQRALLARRFADAGWQVPHLLRAMDGASDFFFDSMGQVRMDRWWRGRVALLGDAGYCPTPLTGLGTSSALVGAYVLAGEPAANTGRRSSSPRSGSRAAAPPPSRRGCGHASGDDPSSIDCWAGRRTMTVVRRPAQWDPRGRGMTIPCHDSRNRRFRVDLRSTTIRISEASVT